MVDKRNDAVWRQRFDSSPPELQRVMLMIVQIERELADLESKSASVGELLPHIRKLHDLQDRESELRGSLSRAHREQAPRPASRRR